MGSVLLEMGYLAAGAILGGVAIWLLYREKLKNADERGKSSSAVELAAARERLQAFQGNIDDQLQRINSLEWEREQLRRDRDALQVRTAELTTELQVGREQANERVNVLTKARDELTLTFKNLANEIFEDKSRRFAQLNKDGLEVLLTPLKDKLVDFQRKVEDTYDKESKERITLKNEIQKLAELNSRISEDAINLTKALTGDPKAQGSWGELVLERILEGSGMREGEEFIVQGSFSGSSGEKLQPDVVINLPERRHIVIDSKVSLTAYERFSSSDDEGQRGVALKQHVVSMRAHIGELSDKNYQNLYALKSLDFVLMFVPIESALMVAIQADREMFLDAFKRNVVIVSPSTLLAMVRTIAHIWRQEQQNRNAQEIARQCGALYDKFVGFVEDLEEVGRKIGAAQKSFDEARGKLSTGRGNLIRQSEKIKELGVKPAKSFPQDLLESAMENEETPNVVRLEDKK